jgi:hypothetical protein
MNSQYNDTMLLLLLRLDTLIVIYVVRTLRLRNLDNPVQHVLPLENLIISVEHILEPEPLQVSLTPSMSLHSSPSIIIYVDDAVAILLSKIIYIHA